MGESIGAILIHQKMENDKNFRKIVSDNDFSLNIVSENLSEPKRDQLSALAKKLEIYRDKLLLIDWRNTH